MPNDINPIPLVEIARSYSYKLNCGNYESRDFFCSQKIECRLCDAERMSEVLYQFCRTQVLKSVKEELEQQKKKQEKAAQRPKEPSPY